MKYVVFNLFVFQAIAANACDLNTCASNLAKLDAGRMAIAYACRAAIGDAEYRLSRTMAEQHAVKSGMESGAAVIAIASLENTIKATATPVSDRAACLESIGDLKWRMRLAVSELDAAIVNRGG